MEGGLRKRKVGLLASGRRAEEKEGGASREWKEG